MQSLGLESSVCSRFQKTPVHNQLDYRILRCVISFTFPLGESWIHCLPTEGLREGYWALSIRIRIYCIVYWRPGIQGETWLPQRCKISQYLECISMHLVLTQPLCISFPQSLRAMISGNTSHYMSGNSLILSVMISYTGPSLRGVCFGEMKAHMGLGGFHAC